GRAPGGVPGGSDARWLPAPARAPGELCPAVPRVHPAGGLHRRSAEQAELSGGGALGGPGRSPSGAAAGRGGAPVSPELAIDVRGLGKAFGTRRVVQGLALRVTTRAICGFLC